jgi:hypothetical protein
VIVSRIGATVSERTLGWGGNGERDAGGETDSGRGGKNGIKGLTQ